MDREITVRGAREHNLKNVDLQLPHGKLICFTGVSGSGKSSLAFDTIYAEGQRRYLESLSSYARQFIGQLPKPDVDHLSGLNPSISISQKSTSQNPRSTVGTITEIQDFLRVLYARVGESFCPHCGDAVAAQTIDQIVSNVCQSFSDAEILILAPLVRLQKGEHRDLFDYWIRQGYLRARVDGQLIDLAEPPALEKLKKHSIELVVDRCRVPVLDTAAASASDAKPAKPSRKRAGDAKTAAPVGTADEAKLERERIFESIKIALRISSGTVLMVAESDAAQAAVKPIRRKSKAAATMLDPERIYSTQFACANCQLSFEPPSPQLLSFNSPQGMCPSCSGLGVQHDYDLNLLIPDQSLSVRSGSIALLGEWSHITKAMQTKLRTTTAAMEAKWKLAKGFLLKTPWAKLNETQRHFILYGSETALSFKERVRRNKNRTVYDRFEGVIAYLQQSYRITKNPLLQRQHEKFLRHAICADCHGERLNPQARNIRLTTNSGRGVFAADPRQSIASIGDLPLGDALEFFENLELDEVGWLIAGEAVKEVRARLGFLLEVGLDYLTLNRTAPTLSGGESQRIRLASQIGSGLVGVTYVLDEPSIGLHARDNDRLIASLKRLRDLGNTLLVVEHDEDTMAASDILVDFGPGPGVRGGNLISVATFEELAANEQSVTGNYISGRNKVSERSERRQGNGKKLTISGARHHNLKKITVDIPLGCLVCVTGVSGSGKSSLITDIVSPALANALMKAQQTPGCHDSINGIEALDKIIDIDQSPIGRTPRSNPATYVKVFDEIRMLFSQLPDAKRRGFNSGRFSFNTEGGRCSACDGNGATRLDMEMLADLWVPCPVCDGKRYDRETLEVQFKGKSIADVLNMDVQEALLHFENVPRIAEKLQTLHDVGLDYIKLGQPSPTLSGGEAQRIKLAKELSRRSTGKTLFVLDEPTTGLHFHDISMLLSVLQKLVDLGNTIVVVEHNLDLIQAADHLIDLGLEGGYRGGEIVATGTPEEVAKHPSSFTGAALKKFFANQSSKATTKRKSKSKKSNRSALLVDQNPASAGLRQIIVQGAQSHNLRSVDVAIERDQMTVFCGRSGSGKTSLAMDTIYAEGQRRYVESLSSYARQFVGQMPKPVVTSVTGLSPAIALEQRNLGHTPRSTVGTVTEIYDYLRVFMARTAMMRCPECLAPVVTQTVDQIVDRILMHEDGTKAVLLAPIAEAERFTEQVLNDAFFEKLLADGFTRVRIDGQTYGVEERPVLDAKKKYDVQVVIDRISISHKSRSRITDSVEQALKLSEGRVLLAIANERVAEKRWKVESHSLYLACQNCGKSFRELTPHHFSFNTSVGWCPRCEGLGRQIGTNLDTLLDPTRSLREHGLLLWPSLDNAMSVAMLESMSIELGVDLDQPIGAMAASEKNLFLYGTGDRWFSVDASSEVTVPFSFQFRGLIPALEIAARASPSLRWKLEEYVAEIDCLACQGSRVRPEAAHSVFRDQTIVDLTNMSLGKLLSTLRSWTLNKSEQKIAGELLVEIERRLSFLQEVGLEYLTLGRAANTLSGGEAQRIRLASQLGSGLGGVLYVLDEPTIGLHPRDNHRLVAALHRLRDNGNTLIVVEHDRDVIASSDRLCDFGPGSGSLGGRVVASGTVAEVKKSASGVTGPYLSGKKAIPVPTNRRPIGDGVELKWLTVRDAHMHTLRHIDVSIPLGRMTAVTGPSGSGKSSLINGILYPALARRLYRAKLQPGAHGSIDGAQTIDKVVRVDQSPLGNSPSSTPATYTGVFEDIRGWYAKQPEAKQLGLTSRDFSFNVHGGRCEKCEGNGQCRIEMHFLPDVWVECDSCHGQRYGAEALRVLYRGKSISEVLAMSVAEAIELFADQAAIVRALRILDDVGLGYVSLGQSAATLSGGEAQRVKLASELARPSTGQTLYLFDEPTTGLHFDDIAKLLHVFNRLVDQGNTVVVIEHNLDVIKSVDWVVELGPEAGWDGGQLVFAGTPEQLVEYAKQAEAPKRKTRAKVAAQASVDKSCKLTSPTGVALAPVLKAGPHEEVKREVLIEKKSSRSKQTAMDSEHFGMLSMAAERYSGYERGNEIDDDDELDASIDWDYDDYGQNELAEPDEQQEQNPDAYVGAEIAMSFLDIASSLNLFDVGVDDDEVIYLTTIKNWFAKLDLADDTSVICIRTTERFLSENPPPPIIPLRSSDPDLIAAGKQLNRYRTKVTRRELVLELEIDENSSVNAEAWREFICDACFACIDSDYR